MLPLLIPIISALAPVLLPEVAKAALGSGDGRQSFGEDAARALDNGATEPANLKVELADPVLPRQVAEVATVTTVDAA
ncbi:hypothetical protein FBZ83_11711 [Azospirillum brasilense]|uniref:Uncharacterized protein n=1 Tax=Azospirillum brasilense TaxID=192 RepID=A0A560BW85_AZOBR|nr:hypothetical protein FBZ83_11711 [Azospirillum brasilense]